MTSVLRNRGSREGFSSAVDANALSALLFDGSCIVIRHSFPSERRTVVDVGEPFFWKILASIAKLSIAVLKDFLTTIFFALFSFKEQWIMHNEVLSYSEI